MPFDEIMNNMTDVAVSAAAEPVFKHGDGDSVQALAMVYSPYQSWEDIYDMEEALKRGTLFDALYKPYIGGNRPK